MEKPEEGLPKIEQKLPTEGCIGENPDALELPAGITREMVDVGMGSDGKWWWYLKKEHREDELWP